MDYLTNVWVNWIEGEEEGYNIAPYYEWRKSDKVLVIDYMPIIYITEKMFFIIENTQEDLPKRLLDYIEDKAYIRKINEKEYIKYAAIVTDGKSVLAFNTLGYSVPLLKSRLTIKQEQEVIKLSQYTKQFKIPFLKTIDVNKNEHIIENYRMNIGLTRRERQLKNILMIAMEHLKSANNHEAICYWAEEWEILTNRTFLCNRSEEYEVLYQHLLQQMNQSWSEAHERFTFEIIKGNEFLEQLWQLEQVNEKNKENQK